MQELRITPGRESQSKAHSKMREDELSIVKTVLRIDGFELATKVLQSSDNPSETPYLWVDGFVQPMV
jgi:hypothetical protein